MRFDLAPFKAKIFLAGCVVTLVALITGYQKVFSSPHRILQAGETYIELHPGDGYLHVIEYDLRPSGTDNSAISAAIKAAKDSVRSASYGSNIFGFENFVPMEEKLYKDKRGIIVGDYKLLARDGNVIHQMKDAFGRILERRVEAAVHKDDIGLYFAGDDLLVSENNSKGVFGKGERRAIFWKNGLNKYEIIFHPVTPLAGPSINAIFGEDVASPEKSEEEINQWKKDHQFCCKNKSSPVPVPNEAETK